MVVDDARLPGKDGSEQTAPQNAHTGMKSLLPFLIAESAISLFARSALGLR